MELNDALLHEAPQIVLYMDDINMLPQSKESAMEALQKLDEVAKKVDLKDQNQDTDQKIGVNQTK